MSRFFVQGNGWRCGADGRREVFRGVLNNMTCLGWKQLIVISVICKYDFTVNDDGNVIGYLFQDNY